MQKGKTNEELNQELIAAQKQGNITKLDLIDKFDEANMHLCALLDALYFIGTCEHLLKINGDTVTVLATMATERGNIMNDVFAEITGEGGK